MAATSRPPIRLLALPPSPTKPATAPSPRPLLLAAQPTPLLLQPSAAEGKEEEEEADMRSLLGSKLTAPTLADLYLAGPAAGFTDTHDLTDAMTGKAGERCAGIRLRAWWCSRPWVAIDGRQQAVTR
jgi:hypothetical protein